MKNLSEASIKLIIIFIALLTKIVLLLIFKQITILLIKQFIFSYKSLPCIISDKFKIFFFK